MSELKVDVRQLNKVDNNFRDRFLSKLNLQDDTDIYFVFIVEGYVEGLLEMIKENAHMFADPKNVIEYVLNMAPHQSWGIESSQYVRDILLITIKMLRREEE